MSLLKRSGPPILDAAPRFPLTVRVGDLICDGWLRVTSIKNTNSSEVTGTVIVVSAVDDAGGVWFRRWDGREWSEVDL